MLQTNQWMQHSSNSYLLHVFKVLQDNDATLLKFVCVAGFESVATKLMMQLTSDSYLLQVFKVLQDVV